MTETRAPYTIASLKADLVNAQWAGNEATIEAEKYKSEVATLLGKIRETATQHAAELAERDKVIEWQREAILWMMDAFTFPVDQAKARRLFGAEIREAMGEVE